MMDEWEDGMIMTDLGSRVQTRTQKNQSRIDHLRSRMQDSILIEVSLESEVEMPESIFATVTSRPGSAQDP